ncbi:MAG TPA: hypothetical protein VH165_00040 [Kofleriaceae bacterium]|jgi:hypothetical protein|nr:hypothetical protein [Kofleriaceae bacterium]
MRFITRNMLVAAIEAQGTNTFDSHAIEQHLYRHEQIAFVRELYENIGAATYPFTKTCRQIGLELSRMIDVVEKIDNVSSPTFSGEIRPCALWRNRRK